jgi:hypothetical protein
MVNCTNRSQDQCVDWYETHQIAFGLKEGCIGKLHCCNDDKICGKLTVNETAETHDVIFVTRLAQIKI